MTKAEQAKVDRMIRQYFLTHPDRQYGVREALPFECFDDRPYVALIVRAAGTIRGAAFVMPGVLAWLPDDDVFLGLLWNFISTYSAIRPGTWHVSADVHATFLRMSGHGALLETA